jgi:hypothetical protein
MREVSGCGMEYTMEKEREMKNEERTSVRGQSDRSPWRENSVATAVVGFSSIGGVWWGLICSR